MSTDCHIESTLNIERAGDDRRDDGVSFVLIRITCWAVAILLAGLRAWGSRNYLQSSDAISYLDLAGHFASGNFSQFINSYWSPLYPALLGVALRVLKPSPYWEFPVAHAVNFLIFVAAFGAFDFLLQQLKNAGGSDDLQLSRTLRLLDEPLWLATSYVIFLYSEMILSGLQVVTPDVLMGVFLLIGAAFIVRIRAGEFAWIPFAAVGFSWGAGYLAKAAMLPLGFAFVLSVFLCAKRKKIRATLITVAAAALIAGPWIWVLSRTVGHLTTGSSGSLNYAWFVNGSWCVDGAHGKAGACPTAPALHNAPRRIFDDPTAVEYSGPVPGTYPPWDDPAYWNDGLRPHFNLAQQLKRIFVSGGEYVQLFLRKLAPITTAILVLAILAASRGRKRALFRNWPLLALAVAGFAMYSLINVDDRFFGTISVIFWLAIMSSIALPVANESQRISRTTAVALMLMLGIYLLADTIGDFKGRYPGKDNPQWQIAQSLNKSGIKQGDAVAVLQVDGTWDWARLARVHIVAEVPAAQLDRFWKGTPALQSAVLDAFAQAGAKAVVAGPLTTLICSRPGTSDPSSAWRPLGETGYYVRGLNAGGFDESGQVASRKYSDTKPRAVGSR